MVLKWGDMATDIFILGGLTMAGIGLWLYEPQLSLVVIGFILFGMGMVPFIKK